MIESDLATFGGRKSTAVAVEDPTTEIDSADWNKLVNAVGQMTMTSWRAILLFPTVAAGNSTPGSTKTFWGGTSLVFPTTVARTAAGAYTVTYPATFADLLGEDETLAFYDAVGHVRSTTVIGHVQCEASGAVVSVQVWNSAFAASDLTVGTTISIYIR